MALNFGRTPGHAQVAIDQSRCIQYGRCVEVCPGKPLSMKNGQVHVDQTNLFGCMGCGHCMAVCPKECVTVQGRDLTPADMLPPNSDRPAYPALLQLMQHRRSVRQYTAQPVPRETLERIVAAAATAPMGLPPSEVGALIWDTPEKVQTFRHELRPGLKSMRWMFAPWLQPLWRLFAGRETQRMLRDFIHPVIEHYIRTDATEEDCFFYHAPAALYFYSSTTADPSDAVIAATHAMLAAEAAGLGACLLGFPGYVMKYNAPLRKKHRLPAAIHPGLCLICGFPEVTFLRNIQRRLAKVDWIGNPQ